MLSPSWAPEALRCRGEGQSSPSVPPTDLEPERLRCCCELSRAFHGRQGVPLAGGGGGGHPWGHSPGVPQSHPHFIGEKVRLGEMRNLP